MGAFIVVVVCLVFIFVIVAIEKPKADAYKKKLAEQEARERAERRAFKEKKQAVLDFAKKNGVDLTSACEERDRLFSQAGRGIFVGSLEVHKPTYTRGAVSGSFADQVSTLANAQKKADYERKIEYGREARNSGYEAKMPYYIKAKEIITILKKMPNSEEYVAFEEEQLEKNWKFLN